MHTDTDARRRARICTRSLTHSTQRGKQIETVYDTVRLQIRSKEFHVLSLCKKNKHYLFVCLSVCLPVCLCLYAALPAYLLARLSVSVLVCLSFSLSVSLFLSLHTLYPKSYTHTESIHHTSLRKTETCCRRDRVYWEGGEEERRRGYKMQDALLICKAAITQLNDRPSKK